LLFALGYLYPIGYKVIKFYITYVKPLFPYHVEFQIHMGYSKYTIKRTIINEGVATCMMSLVYWKSLGSLNLSQYLTMLISFDGHSLFPHGILHTFLVQLGGKMLEVDVEVVDAPLYYNLLLGHNWTYVMTTILSFIFHKLFFPHDGNIMTIDQLSFVYAIPNASVGPSIPIIDNSQSTNENIDIRTYSSFMGTFHFMAPIHHIYAMSSMSSSSMRSIPLFTSYFNDPLTLPSLTVSCEGQSHTRMAMPLSATKIVYKLVLDSSVDPGLLTSHTGEEDPILNLVWAKSLPCSHDFLDDTLTSNEAIVEAMNGSDRTWHHMHHLSYFLPDLFRIEQDDFRSTLSEIVSHVVVPLDTHKIYVERNMENIYPTITIDISHIPRKVENVYIGADCSSEESNIPDIKSMQNINKMLEMEDE
jgi:hypothetical protein